MGNDALACGWHQDLTLPKRENRCILQERDEKSDPGWPKPSKLEKEEIGCLADGHGNCVLTLICGEDRVNRSDCALLTYSEADGGCKGKPFPSAQDRCDMARHIRKQIALNK